MLRSLVVGLIVMFSAAALRGDDAGANKATIAYVQKLQASDGGFKASAAAGASTVRATSAALRALKYFGGKVPDRAACVKFVSSCHDKASGGFADRPGGKPDVFTTAVGVMAVHELGLPLAPYEKRVLKFLGEHARTFEEIRIAAAGCETLGARPAEAAKWLTEVAKTHKSDWSSGTGAGHARDTARVAVTTMRLGGKSDAGWNVVAVLLKGQRPDGGFGKAGEKRSDLESCYQVMRGFHMLKIKPDVDRLAAFVASCRNADGGYGVQPGQPSSVPATYYASIILHWLDAK